MVYIPIVSSPASPIFFNARDRGDYRDEANIFHGHSWHGPDLVIRLSKIFFVHNRPHKS